MAGILLFSEKDENALAIMPRGIEIAQLLKMELNAAVLGTGATSRAAQYLSQGADRVYVSENELLAGFDGKVYSQTLFQIAQLSQAEIVLCVSTKRGRLVAARVAQMLNSVCLTNVLDIKAENGQLITSRYGLGGATIVAECPESACKVVALLPQSFETTGLKTKDGQIVPVELKLDRPDVAVLQKEDRKRESINIEKADVLVCVGKGLQRKEDLTLIQDLAGVVKGEIGCTREISSNLGWLTEDRLVGMSGKRCKPRIVFSIGISGQNQYVAGIVGARVSVAINTDTEAPIFKVTDYGIVGDLYTALPKLIEGLKKQKGNA